MKRVFVMFVLTFACAGYAFGECGDSDKKALEAFDRAWGDAGVKGDRAALMAIYADDYTRCTASFATPITQCGYLDLVRIIVSETIANVGAGTNAQSFFATGDSQRAAGQFKAAYTSYRKAYKAAAK